jgi:D-xylose transport system substrate-binding protein
MRFRGKGVALSLVAVTALVLAGCSNNNEPSSGGTPSAGRSVPQLTAASFTADFSAMSQLKDLAAQGKGKVAVLLPETTTSARYTEFDAPYLTQAFEAAGMTTDDYTITNAQGSDATQKTQAEAAMTSGATVLLLDPIDSGVGAAIESEAASKGVKVIDYDRITLGGQRDYYVSFDNVKVGELIGQGMVDCLTAWSVAKPNILVMRGDPTDNNATLFAQGYDGILQPSFDSGDYVKVGEPAGTWDPPTAQTTFQQQYTAHKNMNAVVTPNDDNANAIISYLKTLKTPANTFPTTGQDATLTGLQNILAGYQCGTVYKPIYLEAQASVALALYLRAGETPPAGLVNGTVKDTQAGADVSSVLLTPVWVTTDNMASTVVADKWVPVDQLCAGKMAEPCASAGIS